MFMFTKEKGRSTKGIPVQSGILLRSYLWLYNNQNSEQHQLAS